jgi:GNAT superfamily N-acetyltransferase
MTLNAVDFKPAPPGDSVPVRLGLEHMPQIEALFATGIERGDAPDFFDAYMVEQGAFYGLYEGDDLISVAGTHLIAPTEGVAAVGNVYSRHDRRGRGLAAQVVSAVTAELLSHQPPLGVVALNVNQSNTTARRLYQRLGYRPYCAFYEGLAEGLNQTSPSLV